MSYVESAFDHLPPILAEATYELAQTLQAPVGMIISTVLGAASLAVQDKIDVERPNGGASPVSLNLLVIAGSGERKSAVFREVFKPFFDLDAAERSQHELDVDRYKREMEAWKSIKTGLERKIEQDLKRGRDIDDSTQRLDDHLAAEPKLSQPRLRVIQDATTDAMLRFLHEKGGSAGLLSDEGGIFFKSRLSSNLAPLNSLWSGDQVYVERVDQSRSLSLSPEVRLTSLVMVQPMTLEAFLKDKGVLSRDNGYLARALICEPATRVGTRFIYTNTYRVPTHGLQNFHDRIREVMARPSKIMLSLSPQAHYAWIDFYNEIERDLLPGGILQYCRDSGSKAPEIVRRLAAIFHCISNAEGTQISPECVFRAVGIMKQYLNESIRLFNPPPAPDPRVEDANVLHAWLLNQLQERPGINMVEKRKILTHGPSRTRNCRNRDDALAILRGWNMVYEFKQNNKLYVTPLVQQAYVNPC